MACDFLGGKALPSPQTPPPEFYEGLRPSNSPSEYMIIWDSIYTYIYICMYVCICIILYVYLYIPMNIYIFIDIYSGQT